MPRTSIVEMLQKRLSQKKAVRSIRSGPVPLGVHIHSTGVCIVAASADNGSLVLRAHAEELLSTSGRGAPIRDQQSEALKVALGKIKEQLKEKFGEKDSSDMNCVLSVLPGDCITRYWERKPDAAMRDIRNAAILQASHELNEDATRINVALDALPNTEDFLLSAAKNEILDSIVAVAKNAGLNPIAIDTPLAAWQRSMQGMTDAIIEVSSRRSSLFVFQNPIGEEFMFPTGMTGERLSEAVRKILSELRIRPTRKIDIKRISIVGDFDKPGEMERLVTILKDSPGLESVSSVTSVAQLTLGKDVNPNWAYAAALATWSIEPAKA